MLHLYTGYILIFLFSLLAAECHSKDDRNIFLWSVENPLTGNKGYLFGTIHVPYTEVWDRVSDRVRDVFSFSNVVLLEVDLHNEETLRKLIKCKNLKRKQTAKTYLPPSLYERIQKFMVHFRNNLLAWAEKEDSFSTNSFKKAKEVYENLAADDLQYLEYRCFRADVTMSLYICLEGSKTICGKVKPLIDEGNWERKRPEWLLFMLYQMCENLMDRPSSPMLDVFLAQKAFDEDKTILAIETAHEQCNPINSISRDDIIFAINYTIHYLEKLHSSKRPFATKKERSISDLVEHYRCGSLEDNIFETNDLSRRGFDMSPMDRTRAIKIDQQLKDDIIVKRNARMAARIDRIMIDEGTKTVFSAIGTGHFFGNSSIVNHLSRLGYIVEPIRDDDVILPPSQSRRGLKFNSMWTRDDQFGEHLDVSIEFVESSHSVTSFLFINLAMIVILQ